VKTDRPSLRLNKGTVPENGEEGWEGRLGGAAVAVGDGGTRDRGGFVRRHFVNRYKILRGASGFAQRRGWLGNKRGGATPVPQKSCTVGGKEKVTSVGSFSVDTSPLLSQV